MLGRAGLVEKVRGRGGGLWGRAFRPFFLLASLQGALVILLWMAIRLGAAPAPGALPPAWWHGHEMLFGFVAAAIAGFLLTAAPVWTGRPALAGRALVALVVLWLAGRLAFAAAGLLPPAAVGAIDVLFLPSVAFAAWRTVRGTGQLRNHGVVAIVGVLALANVAVHAAAIGAIAPHWTGRALRFGAVVVVLLVFVISGRIAPAFTRNAFVRAGRALEVRDHPRWDALGVGTIAALGLTELLAPRSLASGLLAALAGVAACVRMAGWRSRHVADDPLLWSLHLGAAWVGAGLLLVGAGDLFPAVPHGAGLHALTVGAMGATILAVMSRVGLGHTGRPLVLPARVTGCLLLVNGAALLRVASSFAHATLASALLMASALAWALAFGGFAFAYGGILSAPRPDGRPG